MQYLKDDSYYNDLYDLHTIETCLDYYCGLKNGFEKHRHDKDFKKYSKKKFDTEVHKVVSYAVNVIKIQRFRRKHDTVQEWVDRDREKQEKLDSAVEPQGIKCLHCDSEMHSTMKELNDYMDEPLRVLFFFECEKCKKRRGVYDDGTNRVSKPQLCPKCKHEVKVDLKKKGNVITWTTTCSFCDYKEVDVDDMDKRDAEWKKEEEREKLLLKKYRDEFCYTEEVGKEAVWGFDRMLALVEEWKERDKHKEEYDAVAKIKKLTIIELEKLLNDTISPKDYVRLELSKPDFGKHLIVDFTVQDANTSRQEYDSQHGFKKLVQGVLEGSNWRLMSEGVTYRLGYLQGRLKAYEAEEDLLKLVQKSKSK